MTIFLFFLKKYWKHVVITIILLIVFWYAYSKIYNRGFDAANVACEKRIQEYSQKMTEYKTQLDTRIQLIEEASNALVKETIDARKVTKKEFATIITKYVNKPMIVIEDGTCKPSEDFINAYNEAVDRANK